MTEAYNEALSEQLESGIWKNLADEAKSMSKLEYATLTADIVGIFDPTPASDAVGGLLSLAQGDVLGAGLSVLGMVPYVGDLGKIGKIAKHAPKTARALEGFLRYGDEMASLGGEALSKMMRLDQIAAARQKALERVRKAMLDAKQKKPNCKDCKKLPNEGDRQLQMPRKGRNGEWDTPDGNAPVDGTGTFKFTDPKSYTAPDGSTVTVDSIDYKDGFPDFSDHYYGGRNGSFELTEVTGDVGKDTTALRGMYGDSAIPPNLSPTADGWVLHHVEDGSVAYVPRALHDKRLDGVGHTGGNAMVNNDLF